MRILALEACSTKRAAGLTRFKERCRSDSAFQMKLIRPSYIIQSREKKMRYPI